MSNVQQTPCIQNGYIIKYTANGLDGQGTHAFKDRAFVDKYVVILNKNNPKINHYVIDAPPNTPMTDITDYSLESLNEEDLCNHHWRYIKREY